MITVKNATSEAFLKLITSTKRDQNYEGDVHRTIVRHNEIHFETIYWIWGYGWCFRYFSNERKAALVANKTKKMMMDSVGLCYMIERWEWEKMYEDIGGTFHPYNWGSAFSCFYERSTGNGRRGFWWESKRLVYAGLDLYVSIHIWKLE